MTSGNSPYFAIQNLLEQEKLSCPTDAHVLIKPCLETDHVGPGKTTLSESVAAIIDYLHHNDVEKISVGDATPSGTTSRAFTESGFHRLGVNLIDFNNFSDYTEQLFVDSDTHQPGWMPCVNYRKFDFIINLSCMKTDWQSGVALTAKNLLGFIKAQKKRRTNKVSTTVAANLDSTRWYRTYNENLVRLYDRIPVNFAIVDGFFAMEGEGPLHGDIFEFKTVVGGQCSLSVDAVACRLMGIDPHSIFYLKEIAKRTGESMAPSVFGTSVDEIKKSFKLPKGFAYLSV